MFYDMCGVAVISFRATLCVTNEYNGGTVLVVVGVWEFVRICAHKQSFTDYLLLFNPRDSL